VSIMLLAYSSPGRTGIVSFSMNLVKGLVSVFTAVTP
jgi:hypothetical protein